MIAVCHHLLDQCGPGTAASPLAIGTVGADAAVLFIIGLVGGHGRGGCGRRGALVVAAATYHVVVGVVTIATAVAAPRWLGGYNRRGFMYCGAAAVSLGRNNSASADGSGLLGDSGRGRSVCGRQLGRRLRPPIKPAAVSAAVEPPRCDGAFISLPVVLGVALVGGCRPVCVGRDETAVAAAVASI